MASPVLVKDDTEYSDLNAVTIKNINTGIITQIPHYISIDFRGDEEILSWGNPETFNIKYYNGKAAGKYPAIVPRYEGTTVAGLFRGKDLTKSDISAIDLKLSGIDDIALMFSGSTLAPNQINDLDVSGVKIFTRCLAYTKASLDLSKWDMSSAENTSYMFEMYDGGYFGFIGDWDVSNVTNMDGMFKNCTWIEHNDLSRWDVSKITEMPKEFDDGAMYWVGERPPFKIIDPNLPGPDYLTYEDVNKVRKYVKLGDEMPSNDIYRIVDWGEKEGFEAPKGYLILSNTNQVPPSLPKWFTNLSGVFKNGSVPANIGYWDTSHVTDLSDCFNGARFMIFTKLDGWDVSNVKDFTNAFANSNADFLNLGNWDVSGAEKMDGMFHNTSKYNEDLSAWSVDQFEEKPKDFDTGATSWVLPKPKWKGEGESTDPEVPPIDPEVPEIDPPEVPEVDPPIDPEEPLRVGMIRCLDKDGKIVDVTITKGVVIIPDKVRVVIDWGYVTPDYMDSLNKE